MQTNANAANIVNTQTGTKSLIGRFQHLISCILNDDAEILTSEVHDPYARTTGA